MSETVVVKAQTSTVTVTVDKPENVTKIELKQSGVMKYEIAEEIETSNEITDVAYGTYDVVVTAAEGYEATADTPTTLAVNAKTATLAIKIATKDIKAKSSAWIQGTYQYSYTQANKINVDGRSSANSAAAIQFEIPEGKMLTSATLNLTETGANESKTHGKFQVRTFDAAAYATATDYPNPAGSNYGGKYITPYIAASGAPLAETAEDVASGDTAMTAALTGLMAVGTLTLRIDSADGYNQDAKIYDATETNGDKVPTLTNVVLTDAPDMSTITIKYQKEDDGSELHPTDGRDTSVEAPQGAPYQATDAMKADFKIGETKYTLSDTSQTSVTPDSSTAELVLTFKEAEKKTIHLKTKVGEEAETVIDTAEEVYVGDKITFVWPKYLTGEGNKVTATCNEDSYSEEITVNADTTDKIVNYTSYSGDDMYFVEVEEVSQYTKATSTNQHSAKMSKGYGADIEEDDATAKTKPVFTVPATGQYKVTAVAISKNARMTDAAIAIYKNDAAVAENKLVETKVTSSCNSPATVTTTDNVDLTENDTILLLDVGPNNGEGADNSNRIIVDYVLLVKASE